MSSVAVVPAGAVVAVVALPVIAIAAAGAAAVMVVRACGAATAATGLAMEHLGEAIERHANEQDQLAVREKLWQLAACEVVSVNADIRLLAERARAAGIDAGLPAPLAIAGHDIATIHQLVTTAERSLIQSRRKVDAALAAQEQAHVLAGLPAPAHSGLSAASLLAGYQKTLEQRREAEPVEADTAAALHDELPKRVEAVLARLHLAVTAAERRRVLEAAARVLAQTTAADASTYLLALREIVEHDVNPCAQRRHQAAIWLDGLENPVVVEAIAATRPIPPFLNSAARLRQVVRGEADLTEDLERQARDALAWAEKAAHRKRVLEAVCECLKEQKFQVQEGFSINNTPGLRASLPAWNGEHSADLWIDDAGVIKGELLRERDQVSYEHDRCVQLGTQLEDVAKRLASKGFATAGVKSDPARQPRYRKAAGPAAVNHAEAKRPNARHHETE